MFLKVLVLIFGIVGGGESDCEAIVQMTLPPFQEFSWNVTRTKSECKNNIDAYGPTMAGMSPDVATAGLQAIYTGCSNAILGFLVETVSLIGALINVDPNELLDIATGIQSLPVPMPQKCIGVDLTHLFDQIMEADAEFSAKVEALLPKP